VQVRGDVAIPLLTIIVVELVCIIQNENPRSQVVTAYLKSKSTWVTLIDILEVFWLNRAFMNITTLTPKQLRQAADLKEQILSLQGELGRLVGNGHQPVRSAPGRRKMSAAGRARIAAAQRARWAKTKKEKPSVKRTAKPKRTMSPAARAKLAASARKRWQKAKAQGKTSL
jgi:hypothetical protein